MKKSARNKKETVVEKVEEAVIEAVIPELKEQRKVKNFVRNKPFILGVVIILAIFAGAGGLYAYLYFQKDASPSNQNAQLTSEQIENLVNEVERLVVLPEGETPTVATVTDVEKLVEQPFFKTAENGDKVLLYGSTKEAILYRPSIGKIIRIAPINSTDIATPSPSLAPETVVSGTPTVTPSVQKIKVAIFNSTKEAGLARKAGALLDKDKYEVVATSNAVGEYSQTTISKVSGSSVTESELKKIVGIMSSVKAQVKTLPTGESVPTGAEVVVILGADFSDAY